MNLRFRSILAISIIAIVLAACGTTVAAPESESPAPSQPATPSVQPSVAPSEAPVEPSEPAVQEREIAGILTAAEMAYSGPGGTIQEALDNGPTGNDLPTLVRGILFRDVDGTLYLATSVSDETTPTFEGPMLEVRNMPNDGPSWDVDNADLLGLREANGIIFYESTILGFLELA
jgi:hypothetical protein